MADKCCNQKMQIQKITKVVVAPNKKKEKGLYLF